MNSQPTQGTIRRSIDVGPAMGQVSSVTYWLRQGYFANEDEARGAFRLAYQQGLDGMGTSIAAWMGLNTEEFDAWMCRDELPRGGVFKK